MENLSSLLEDCNETNLISFFSSLKSREANNETIFPNDTLHANFFESDPNCSRIVDHWRTQHDPEYYSYTYRIVGTLFQGIVFLVGLLGNLMVVFVVARTRSMHSPTNCYLVSLAAADCVVLLASVPNEIISYYLIGNQWIWGQIGCSVFIFFQNLGINASALSLTAFTVERYIAICHPMKAQAMCTVARAKKIIFGVWVFAVVYCSPWLTLTTTKPYPYKGYSRVEACGFKYSRQAYLGFFLTDIFLFYVFPLLLSVVLYGLIARILFISHGAKRRSKANGETRIVVESTKSSASRDQVVKMLVMVVAIFAVLWLPYRGLLVYNSFAPMFGKDIFMDLWFLMFSKTCIYINSAINPILYNAMSVKFRRAFGRTLMCGKGREVLYCRSGTLTTCTSGIFPPSQTQTPLLNNPKRNHRSDHRPMGLVVTTASVERTRVTQL